MTTRSGKTFLRYLVSTPNLILFALPALFWVVGVYDILSTPNHPMLLMIPTLFTLVWFFSRVYWWRQIPVDVPKTFNDMLADIQATDGLGSNVTLTSPNASVSTVTVYPDADVELCVTCHKPKAVVNLAPIYQCACASLVLRKEENEISACSGNDSGELACVGEVTNLEDIATIGQLADTNVLPESVALLHADKEETRVVPFAWVDDFMDPTKLVESVFGAYVPETDKERTLTFTQTTYREPRKVDDMGRVMPVVTPPHTWDAHLYRIDDTVPRVIQSMPEPVRMPSSLYREEQAQKREEPAVDNETAGNHTGVRGRWNMDPKTNSIEWWMKEGDGPWVKYAVTNGDERERMLSVLGGSAHFDFCGFQHELTGYPGCVCRDAARAKKASELAAARNIALKANRAGHHALAAESFRYVEDLKVTHWSGAYVAPQVAFEASLAAESEDFWEDEDGDEEAFREAVEADAEEMLGADVEVEENASETRVDASSDAEIERVADDHADVIAAILEAEEAGDHAKAERLAEAVVRAVAGIPKPITRADAGLPDVVKDEFSVPKAAIDGTLKVTSATEVQTKVDEHAVTLSKAREVVVQQIERVIVPAVVQAMNVQKDGVVGEIFHPEKRPESKPTWANDNGDTFRVDHSEADEVQYNFRTKPLRYIVTPDPGALPCGVLEGGKRNFKVLLANTDLGAMMRVETKAQTPYHTKRCSYWKNKSSCSCKFANRKFPVYT